MKQLVQKAVRNWHIGRARGNLPPRVAIYLHEVRSEWLDQLRLVLRFFAQEGYRFVTPHELMREDGGLRFCVTYDDNYQNWLGCLPILEELGVRATFYVTSGVFRNRADRSEIESFLGRVNRPRDTVTLSTDELLIIKDGGHQIGLHGHRHRLLSTSSPAEGREDLVRCKDLLEELCSDELTDYAYPYGMPRFFPTQMRTECQRAGIRSVAHGVGGMQYAEWSQGEIHRTLWRLWRPLEENLGNLRIDGQRWVALTGKDPTAGAKRSS